MWCQLPTSPVLWPMRVPSSGSGPLHLESPSPRCGLLMGQGPALCRYLRSLQPMQGTTHVKPASMGILPALPVLFNSIVSGLHYYDHECWLSSISIVDPHSDILVTSPNLAVTLGDSSATLSCEVYGYLMRQPPTITWNLSSDVLMNDSVFIITVQDGSHMIQNGGDTPQPSMRSVLTINHPNQTHEGSYICSVVEGLSAITLEVIGGRFH